MAVMRLLLETNDSTSMDNESYPCYIEETLEMGDLTDSPTYISSFRYDLFGLPSTITHLVLNHLDKESNDQELHVGVILDLSSSI